MGITKKELRQIIKEEVLKELQRLDEAWFPSTGSNRGTYISPERSVRMGEEEAEELLRQARISRYHDEDPWLRAGQAADAEEERRQGTREEKADKLRLEARKYLMQLSALNKKGWFTRNTPIGGNWKKQRMALLKKLSDINEEVQRLLPPPLRGYTPGKSTDWSNYYLGAYTNVYGDGNIKTFRVYALPAGRYAPTDGGSETINFHDFIQMVKDGNNR